MTHELVLERPLQLAMLPTTTIEYAASDGKPDVVFELTSRGTKSEDQWTKKGFYEELGVKEYFLFDPLGDYLRPPLQGYRLVNGRYQALSHVPLRGCANGQMESSQLGLRLQGAGEQLELFDQQTGKRVLPPLDMAELVEEAQTQLYEIQAALEETRLGWLTTQAEFRSHTN